MDGKKSSSIICPSVRGGGQIGNMVTGKLGRACVGAWVVHGMVHGMVHGLVHGMLCGCLVG